jgi:hypothetical protein
MKVNNPSNTFTKHLFFRNRPKRILQKLGLWRVNKPDFFVLGVQKAGTTSLHNQLQTHPDLVGPIELKECHFFDTVTELNSKNIAAYERHFYPNWFVKGKRNFESTPRYIFLESALALLHEYAPSAKFILVLREPAERAFSQWSMRRWTADKGHVKAEHRPFDECVSELTHQYVTRGYYAAQLKTYLKYFDAQQLHIVDFTAFKNRNAEVMAGICGFLGLQAYDFQPLHSYQRLKDVEHEYEESLRSLRVHYKPMNAELKQLLADVWGTSMSWLDSNEA